MMMLMTALLVNAAKGAPPMERAELLQTFGRANAFKEGDAAIGVAAKDDAERKAAREKLAAIKLGDLDSRRFIDDEVSRMIMESLDPEARQKVAAWTVGDLKKFFLEKSEAEIKALREGLSSEAIAAAAKLMTDDELIAAAAKIYNPNAGSTFGAKGYFGSRIQPNSPTDDPEEVLFSTLEGLSYGCGDVVLGINPVDSDRRNVKRLEETLRDVVKTFGLEKATTYCVLAHIDDQMAVHENGLVNVGFQSLGGTAKTNATFNIDVEKMLRHLSKIDHQYFETGQGSAFTNNAADGVDMVTLESRAYGLARAFAKKTHNWTIVNDVAGFIGPEVFASGEQLIRACLEDLFMGKVHGLAMGLDICSTYHMGVEIDELDRAMDRVMQAGPAYYMAVAGKSDPMLSYITTAYRDHPRLRKTHGRKVSDAMQKFFESIGVMDAKGEMTAKAGDTAHVYAAYRRKKGDQRPEPEIRKEAEASLKKFQARGLDLGYGHDGNFGMPPKIKDTLYKLYADAKRALYLELPADFFTAHADALVLETTATDRKDYVAHPPKGETLSEKSLTLLREHRKSVDKDLPDVQVVISDGLNAESISAKDQLDPFLTELKNGLKAKGLKSGRDIIVKNGRVRAGYQVGQELFGQDSTARNAVVHVIGERPGNGQNTYSVYIGGVPRLRWKAGINHDVVRVVSGVSVTSTLPAKAAQQVLEILLEFLNPQKSATPPAP